jgi:DNA-binding transcriptional LysR family regulator
LAALESSIGEALFVRTPKGMQPTERGKLLYGQIVESLDRLERVTQSLQRSETVLRPLRLGTSPDFFSAGILPRVAGQGLALRVQFGDIKDQPLLAQLEAGTLDVVIGVQRPAARGLEHRMLRDKHFYLIAPPSTQPPKRNLEAWLSEQAWVSYGAELPLIRRFWNAHLGKRFDATLALVVPDLRSLLHAVELGVGLSILPDFLCDQALEAGRVQRLLPRLEVAPSERWIMSYREVDALRPEIAQLAGLLATPG